MPFHDTDAGTTRYEGQHGYKAVHCPVCQATVILDADAVRCRCGYWLKSCMAESDDGNES